VHLLLAFGWPFPNPLNPVIALLTWVLHGIHGVIPSYGWSLIVLALGIRLLFWPLQGAQLKSTAEMQKVAPLVKAMQTKYKGDAQKIQTETMALYKEHGVNPFAGCLPLLLQMPILFSIYWVITAPDQQVLFQNEHWAWIGSGLADAVNTLWLPIGLNVSHWHAPEVLPHFLAMDLTQPDYLLLALYIVSMYLSVRFGSPPSTDPQQAQTQKIMAIMSPAMIAWFGRGWPSAMLLYWFFVNLFTMAQTMYFFRKFKMGWFAEKPPDDGKTPPKNGTLAVAGTTGGRTLVANGTVKKAVRQNGSKRRSRR
jgi:YidC/Oxa1 family membrane protein insertase